MITLQHIIDGDNVTGTSETLFDIYDPSTGKITKQIQGASANDVQKAIKVANEKLASWSQVTASTRAQIMFNYRDLIIKHTDELAKLISQDHGKTFADALSLIHI